MIDRTKTFRISEIEGDYILGDQTGTVVRTGKNPRRLAEWALDNGADAVRHEYDLRKADI